MGKQQHPLIPMETEEAQASTVRVTSDRRTGHRGGDFLCAAAQRAPRGLRGKCHMWRVARRGQRRGSDQSDEAAAESQGEGAHV